MKRALIVAVLSLGVTATAAAQESVRFSGRGFGGITFMTETSTLAGAGVAVRVHRDVEIVGELGRMSNVLPHKLQRDLDDAARSIGSLFGGRLTIDGKAPAVYGLATLRFSRAASSRMRVYAEAGGGSVRGRSDITAVAGSQNVSREVVASLGIKKSEVAGLVALGGGITLPLTGDLGLDLGYRFIRIFTDDPRINTANMTAGVRWGF
jgi:opacity protein-like surface antigen